MLNKINSKQWRPSHLFPYWPCIKASPDHWVHCYFTCSLSGKPPALAFITVLPGLYSCLNNEPKGKGKDWGKKVGKGERAIVAKGT